MQSLKENQTLGKNESRIDSFKSPFSSSINDPDEEAKTGDKMQIPIENDIRMVEFFKYYTHSN